LPEALETTAASVNSALLTRANGQPAVAWYLWSEDRERYLPASIEVLALEGERVREITAFASAELFPQFGLPPELPVPTRRAETAVSEP
jgi:hypothetical protein